MAAIYNNIFSDTEKNLTNEDLTELEKKYDFQFPKDIRDHYLAYNGGETERYLFMSNGRGFIVNRFIPIKYTPVEGGETVEFNLDMLRKDNIFPAWLIPFADDPGGDIYCFSLKKNEGGAIYYWSHEYDYGDNREKHVLYLAKSIKDFIDTMVEDE